MANIILDAAKGKGVTSTLSLNAGDTVTLRGFELAQAERTFVNGSGQLVIVLQDGTQFLLSNFAQLLADNPEQDFIVSEDGPLSYSEVIAKFIEGEESVEDVEPALGPEPIARTAGGSSTLGEGSNAAENSDLGGPGFTFGTFATSENPAGDDDVTEPTDDGDADQGIDVTPFDDLIAPTVNDGTIQGLEDTTFALNVATPTDVDSDDTLLSITVTGLPNAAVGVIQLSGVPIALGQVLTPAELTSLTFVTTPDFNGTGTFNYNIIDTDGNVTPSTHTIDVTAVEDSPVVSGPSSLTVVEDSGFTDINFAIPTDADTPYGDVLTTVIITTPLSNIQGTITLNNVEITDGQQFTIDELGLLQFQPNADFTGSINIDYTTSDLAGNTVTNTHTITVSPVNDIPVVTNSASSQDEDSAATALNIIAPTDVDGDVLTITLDALPTDGTLTYADNTPVGAGDTLTVAQLTGLQFTPNADFNGDIVINYTVNDGTVDVTGNHTVTVNAVNDAPVVTNSTSSQDEDSSSIALNIPSPTDVDGDVLTITLNALPTDGTLLYADDTLVGAGDQLTAAQLTGLQFTPNANFNGNVVINYTVNDGTVDVAGNHTITVNAINDAPVVVNSTSSQDEDSASTALNIPAPTDVDNDVLTITLDALPTNGTLTYADNTLVGAGDTLTVAQLTGLQFTPSLDFNGDVVINYTVNDGTVDVAGNHTISVASVNDDPVANDSTSTQNEDSVDGALNIPTPTDVDSSSLLAKIDVLPTDGTLKFSSGVVVTAGVEFDVSELPGLTFTPNADFNGDVSFTYEVLDDAGGSDTAVHTITVSEVNDAPVVGDSVSDQNEDSGAITLNIPAPTDVDGDVLTITLGGLPANGTLLYADDTPVGAADALTVAQLTGLKFSPDSNFNGNVALNFTVNDGTVSVAGSHTITVNAVNDAPVVTNSSSSQPEDSGTQALGIPAPTDVDNDVLSITITLDELPTGGTLTYADNTPVALTDVLTVSDLTGLQFTPALNFNGSVSINYTVTDGTLSVAGNHVVTVGAGNDAPVVINSISSQDEDSAATALDIPAPTDVDGDVLSITIDALPTNGVLTYADNTPVGAGDLLTVAQLTGLEFTPNADFNGDVVINYTVNDGSVDVTGSHTVKVGIVNDAPVVADSASSQNEDSVSISLNIPSPTDIDGDSLSITLASLPANGTLTYADNTLVGATDVLTVAQLTGLQFTPNADFNGDVTISYVVNDGTVNVVGNHTITVNPINDLPVVTNSASTQDEDSSAVALNITAPTDVDGDVLTITLDSLPTDGVLTYADNTLVGAGDSLTVAQLTGLLFTPNADFNGSVVINYTVNDGTVNVGGSHTVTVNAVNDAPVVTDSTSNQAEDSVSIPLNISTPTDVDGDVLTITIDALPTDGTLLYADDTVVGAGDTLTVAQLTGLQFTPNADFTGNVAINYTVNDGTVSVGGTHTVTVGEANDAPVVTDSTSAQDEDTASVALNIPAPTDIDGDVLTVTIDALPTDGTLLYADDTVVGAGDTLTVAQLTGLQFTPNADFNGTVAVNYTVNDGTVNVGGTHTVTVNPINDAPVVVNSTSNQEEDSGTQPLNIPAPTDVDNDVLSITISLTELPTDGTLTYADNTPVALTDVLTVSDLTGLQFTPNANFTGSVVINYTVNDGTVDVDGNHVITVGPINDLPVVTDSTSTQDEDSASTALNIPAPTDVDGDVLTITIDALPTNGTLTYADNSAVGASDVLTVAQLTGLQFTPSADFNGTVDINYTVNDGSANVGGTHTVTINPVNDAPVANDSTSTQDEDTVSIPLNIPAPTDIDGDVLTITIDALPTDGTLLYADDTVVGAGDSLTVAQLTGLQFTPNANFAGNVAISYTVSDGSLTDTATHTVTVDTVNDAPVVNDSTSMQDEDSENIVLGIDIPTDPDGDALLAQIDTLPNDGLLRFGDNSLVRAGESFDADRLAEITFTPNPDFNGDVAVSYNVTDGTSTVSATHTITVGPIPDGVSPGDGDLTDDANAIDINAILRAAEIEDCVLEGTYQMNNKFAENTLKVGEAFNLTVPADAFTDIEGGALTYSATYTNNGVTVSIPTSHLNGGFVISPTTGLIVGMVPATLLGETIITITATSSNGSTASKSISYDVFNQERIDNIDVIAPRYGDYLIPHDNGDNLMVGIGEDDILRYDLLTHTRPIFADLNTGIIDKGNGFKDVADGFKEIVGTEYNDVIIAEDGIKTNVNGYLGDDFIYSSSGNDIIVGGEGSDTVSYARSTAAVNVDLDGGNTNWGYAQHDTLVQVENLQGSDFNDVLKGNSVENTLEGGKGSDSLYGLGGHDTFLIDRDDAVVDGGSHADTIKITDANSWSGNHFNFSNSLVGHNIDVSSIEEIDMTNSYGGEVIHMDIADLLSTAQSNEIIITGNVSVSGDDDKIHLADKTSNEIIAADGGSRVVNGIEYQVLNFANEGTLFVQSDIDILDASGDTVI